jgi:hypothetical protein
MNSIIKERGKNTRVVFKGNLHCSARRGATGTVDWLRTSPDSPYIYIKWHTDSFRYRNTKEFLEAQKLNFTFHFGQSNGNYDYKDFYLVTSEEGRAILKEVGKSINSLYYNQQINLFKDK